MTLQTIKALLKVQSEQEKIIPMGDRSKWQNIL